MPKKEYAHSVPPLVRRGRGLGGAGTAAASPRGGPESPSGEGEVREAGSHTGPNGAAAKQPGVCPHTAGLGSDEFPKAPGGVAGQIFLRLCRAPIARGRSALRA